MIRVLLLETELDPNQTNFTHAARGCMTSIDSVDLSHLES